nr:MAG TPA: hypothetical protein [Caudoviricetes sp.]
MHSRAICGITWCTGRYRWDSNRQHRGCMSDKSTWWNL